MKRIIASLLLLCMFSFVACDTDNTTDDTTSTDTNTSETTTEETDTTAETTGEETETDTTAETTGEETETETETTASKIEKYYVKTPEQPPRKTRLRYTVYTFESYDEAVAKANDKLLAASGYAVYDDDGKFLYGVNNEYVTNMLYRAKYVVDFAKKSGYKYGSAAKNPAVTFHSYLNSDPEPTEKIVSCDRFVGWVLYEMGYTDQPIDGGMYVWGGKNDRDHNLMLYLDKHNYQRIENTTDFKAGDIVFVNPTQSTGGEPFGAHVFICAGDTGTPGQFYRYDHGSDSRIQSTQPSKEGIGNLFCVYRPTQTKKSDMPSSTTRR